MPIEEMKIVICIPNERMCCFMPQRAKISKIDISEQPESIYLTADEINAKLFSGIRYAWVCGYDYANYGGSYYYEFYHLN